METPLYDTDFNLWIADTVAKLKAKQFDRLDLDNLIDEVESLSKRDRRELINRLTTLFEHLLKLHFVPLPDCSNGWRETIKRTKKRLKLILQDSPSLRNFGNEVILDAYQSALSIVKAGYPCVDFPDYVPFSFNIDRLGCVDRGQNYGDY